MEIIKRTTHKARKEHKCDYCGSIISKGTSYIRTFIKNGGEAYEWLSHLSCELLVNKFDSNYFQDDGDGISKDMFLGACLDFSLDHICSKCEASKDKKCELDLLICTHKILDILTYSNIEGSKLVPKD